MALFERKEKKLSLDDILKGLDYLSDEEKAKVKAKMDDLYKAEDEREIDKIEEDKASDSEVKDEKAEEVAEESEEIGKDVDTVEDEVKEDELTPIEIKDKEDDGVEVSPLDNEDGATDKVESEEATSDIDKDTELDASEVEVVDDKEDEKEDVGERLAERVSGLEKELAEYKSFIAELRPLLELAQDFTQKQAKSFGYSGDIPGVKKDINDMDLDELKKTLASEL